MHISRLELNDFRNYHRWVLEPERALTVLTGPNASGKTNAIEAIQATASGVSFRNPNWRELVRFGESRAIVRLTAHGTAGEAQIELTIAEQGSKEWCVNQVRKRRATDATRIVPTVVFTPDDLALVKGPAERRRAALDALGEQLSLTYRSLRRDYERVVRQRNTLLRDEAPRAMVEAWDDQLVTLGARLHLHRRRLAARILEAAAPVYARLAGGEQLDMELHDHCGTHAGALDAELDTESVEHALRGELARRRADEARRKVSLAGPHRDDIVVLVAGKDARTYASQGQQRTIALAWKWAEVGVIESVLHKTPVLLLDDVMSELDEMHRHALTDLVQRDVQTFITTTNPSYFDGALLQSALVVPVGGEAR